MVGSVRESGLTAELPTFVSGNPCGNDRRGSASGCATPSAPSVIPDAPPLLSFPMPPVLSFPTFLIGNPEFPPGRGHTNGGTKEKDSGFPLTPAGMTEGLCGNACLCCLPLPLASAACLPPPASADCLCCRRSLAGAALDMSHRGTVWREEGRDAGSDVSVA